MPVYLIDETRKLTAQQRKRIAAAFGKRSAETIDSALTRIEFEMQNYLGYANAEQVAVKPKLVNDALAAVKQRSERFSQALALLPSEAREPLEMWFHTSQLRRQKGRADRNYVGIRELIELVSDLRVAAENSRKVGKPPDRALRTYIWQLATIFRDASGKLPTRSYDDTRAIGQAEGGIARQFFSACLDAAGYKGYPQGAIKQVLTRLRSMDKNPERAASGNRSRKTQPPRRSRKLLHH